jgi:hypothetical protein
LSDHAAGIAGFRISGEMEQIGFVANKAIPAWPAVKPARLVGGQVLLAG